MIEALISSKTRIKLLLKFFLNSKTTGYLRGLESEFGESSNAIRIELNRFEKAGMLKSFIKGNKKLFAANTDHPLHKDIHNIILKYIGFDKIIENVVDRLGTLKRVYISGEFAKGNDSHIIDLVFVGDLDQQYLINLIQKAEGMISRKIRYIVYSENELETKFKKNTEDYLLLWEKD